MDQGPIFVLAEPSWKPLLQDYLAYVDPNLSTIDASKISSISRQMNGETVELVRQGAGWDVKAKATQPGDAPTINSLVDHLAQVHANRIAAYPAKEPASYGLDKPEAVFTVRFTGADGKPATKAIQIGKTTADADTKGDRFVRVENGTAIGVLPTGLVDTLLKPALEFRNRNLVNLASVDRATVEHGQRKAVFESANGAWKMIQPDRSCRLNKPSCRNSSRPPAISAPTS